MGLLWPSRLVIQARLERQDADQNNSKNISDQLQDGCLIFLIEIPAWLVEILRNTFSQKGRALAIICIQSRALKIPRKH